MKLLVWVVVLCAIALAIMLPVVVVTGMFGGHPVAGMVGLIGLVLLALGVAWYVRTHGRAS